MKKFIDPGRISQIAQSLNGFCVRVINERERRDYWFGVLSLQEDLIDYKTTLLSILNQIKCRLATTSLAMFMHLHIVILNCKLSKPARFWTMFSLLAALQ